MWRGSFIPTFLVLGHLAAAFDSSHRPLHQPSTKGAHPVSRLRSLLQGHVGGARPGARLHRADSQAQVSSRTLQDLLERKRNLTGAVERSRGVLEAASKRHTNRKKRLDGLIQVSVRLDLDKDALEAKLQQLQRSKAAAAGITSKVSLVKSNSMVQLATDLESENAMLQAEIEKYEKRNEKLAGDVREMRERGLSQAVQEARARIREAQEDLHEFTGQFARAQSELNSELTAVLQPWAKHWEGQATGREEDEDDELSNLEPQMHMKAYDTIRNFDAKLVNAAREQTCYFDERMGEQVTALDSVEETLQPAT